MKKKLFEILLILLLTISCKTEKKEVTKIHKAEHIAYVNQLVKEINNYNYYFVRTNWNKEYFKSKITGLTKSERAVFEAYYDTFFRRQVLDYSLEYLESIEKTNGRVYLAENYIENNYSIVSLVSSNISSFDFWKLKIEKVKGKFYITDLISLKDNIWLSQKMKRFLNLNSKYVASNANGNRYKANMYLEKSNAELKLGNYYLALEYLNKIPESHVNSFEIANRKLQVAANIDEQTYFETLDREYKKNKFLYVEYLKHYYSEDSIKYYNTIEKINTKINLSEIHDSIFNENKMWN